MPAPTTLYSIGEVAAIVGVSPHTIRAWERRYGIVRPERTPTHQRRYRGEDIELLRDVRRAIQLKGLSLRLAFQAVTGNLDATDMIPYRRRPSRAERWTPPGDAAMWRAISDVVPELILVIDKDGTIVEVNVAVARAFGTTRQRFIGRTVTDLVDAFDRPKVTMLYRPELRAVTSWELNMATQKAPSLYSFQTWKLRQDDRALLAMVGSEMYRATIEKVTRPDRLPQVPDLSGADTARVARADQSAFETLIEQLPFGVGVVTIGSQPRLVYGNSRLPKTLRLPDTALTGRTLSEVLPNPSVIKTLREAINTRRSRTLRGVESRGAHSKRGRLLDLEFRPMLSSHRLITAALLVAQDATLQGEAGPQIDLDRVDARLRGPTHAAELAQVMLELLTSDVPGVEFVAQVNTPSKAGAKPVMRWSASWFSSEEEIVAGPVGEVISQAVTSGSQITGVMAGRRTTRSTVTAIPLRSSGQRVAPKVVAVVAWRRDIGHALSGVARRTLEALITRMTAAAELLDIRSELAAKTALLESIIAATSLVSNSVDKTALGNRFLEVIARARHADGAIIGRAEGADFVIQAAYSSTGQLGALPGDRYPLGGGFVSQSLQSGEPTAAARLGSLVNLPNAVRKALRPMKHALAVPLVVEGTIAGVLALFRTSNAPFTAEDSDLVQSVSAAAMLSVQPIGLTAWRSANPPIGRGEPS